MKPFIIYSVKRKGEQFGFNDCVSISIVAIFPLMFLFLLLLLLAVVVVVVVIKEDEERRSTLLLLLYYYYYYYLLRSRLPLTFFYISRYFLSTYYYL